MPQTDWLVVVLPGAGGMVHGVGDSALVIHPLADDRRNRPLHGGTDILPQDDAGADPLGVVVFYVAVGRHCLGLSGLRQQVPTGIRSAQSD